MCLSSCQEHSSSVCREFESGQGLFRPIPWYSDFVVAMSGPLRFRTPLIEELPVAHAKQAPGFAWVAVSGPQQDPSKNWGADKAKRTRTAVQGPTEAQREALNTRQQREIERRIRDLNNDNSKDVQIPMPKKEGAGGGGSSRAGKTPNTKKILSSGKTFAHYLDDEEAEIARTGKRDGDLDVFDPATLVVSNDTGESSEVPGVSRAQLDALLNAPPLTYNQARSAPPPADAPPPRRFCQVCGFFERAKCQKCSASYCSVACKDTHDADQCLKFYA